MQDDLTASLHPGLLLRNLIEVAIIKWVYSR